MENLDLDNKKSMLRAFTRSRAKKWDLCWFWAGFRPVGKLWATFEGGFFMFSGPKKEGFFKEYPGVCTEKRMCKKFFFSFCRSGYDVVWKKKWKSDVTNGKAEH